MYPKGYVLMVRNYKAEIVPFETINTIELPDGSLKYYVRTKFGEDYFNESDISPIKRRFLDDCNKLNEALEKAKRGMNEGSVLKPRQYW